MKKQNIDENDYDNGLEMELKLVDEVAVPDSKGRFVDDNPGGPGVLKKNQKNIKGTRDFEDVLGIVSELIVIGIHLYQQLTILCPKEEQVANGIRAIHQ